MSDDRVWGVVVAGLGGQGVIKASDILAEAAFQSGWDVKKAEVHGMSQRGGSVASEVRFGPRVLSPMIPVGQADFMVLCDSGQAAANSDRLAPNGLLIGPDAIDASRLSNKRSFNIALLGVLAPHLPLDPERWRAAIRSQLAEPLWKANLEAFEMGREAAGAARV